MTPLCRPSRDPREPIIFFFFFLTLKVNGKYTWNLNNIWLRFSFLYRLDIFGFEEFCWQTRIETFLVRNIFHTFSSMRINADQLFQMRPRPFTYHLDFFFFDESMASIFFSLDYFCFSLLLLLFEMYSWSLRVPGTVMDWTGSSK